jgi:hypothetical protein
MSSKLSCHVLDTAMSTTRRGKRGYQDFESKELVLTADYATLLSCQVVPQTPTKGRATYQTREHVNREAKIRVSGLPGGEVKHLKIVQSFGQCGKPGYCGFRS